MKKKYFGIGFLTGFVIGIIIIFVFPAFLYMGLHYNRLFNQSTGSASDFYSVRKGSIYVTTLLPLFVFGLLGGGIGILIAKIVRFFSPKTTPQ